MRIKSIINLGLLASFLGLAGAKAVKSCGRAAKGGKYLDDVVRVNKINRATNRLSKNAVGAVSYIDDVGNAIDFLEVSEDFPTVGDINIELDSTNLYQYFSHITPEMFTIDRIYTWEDMDFYIPKCYSVRQYKSRKRQDVLDISYGLDRFTVKKANIFSRNYESDWTNNRKGILYKSSESSYQNSIFTEIYYLKTSNYIYQIHYVREDVDKFELSKCTSRLSAFVQLIALN